MILRSLLIEATPYVLPLSQCVALVFTCTLSLTAYARVSLCSPMRLSLDIERTHSLHTERTHCDKRNTLRHAQRIARGTTHCDMHNTLREAHHIGQAHLYTLKHVIIICVLWYEDVLVTPRWGKRVGGVKAKWCSYVLHNWCIRAAWLVCMCSVAHSIVCHDSFVRMKRCVCTCDITHSDVWYDSFRCHLNVWRDSFRCVAWLICMCDMTPCVTCVEQMETSASAASKYDSFQNLKFMCVTSLVFIYMKWLIRICGRTRLYVWDESFVWSKTILKPGIKNMTHSYVRHDSFICAAWLIHIWGMTHLCVRHDSFIYGAWLIYVRNMTPLTGVWRLKDEYVVVHPYKWVIYTWVKSQVNVSQICHAMWHIPTDCCVTRLMHMSVTRYNTLTPKT